MILAWTKEVVGGFLHLFGANRESDGVKTCIILFAVLFVYVLDFAINVSKYRQLPANPARVLGSLFHSTSWRSRVRSRLCTNASAGIRKRLDHALIRCR